MKEKEKFNIILISFAAVIVLVVGVTFIVLTNYINEYEYTNNDNIITREVADIAPQNF